MSVPAPPLVFDPPPGPLPRQDDDFYWNRLVPYKRSYEDVQSRRLKRNEQSGQFAYLTGRNATVIDPDGTVHRDAAAIESYRWKDTWQPYQWQTNPRPPLEDMALHQDVTNMIRRIRSEIGSYPLKVKRFIGEGGHGAVALCDYVPRKDETSECIVKVARTPNGQHILEHELHMLDQFGGAKHLVHPLDGNLECFWHLQLTRGRNRSKPVTVENVAKVWYTREKATGEPAIALMEHCHLGDLGPWINKAANNKTEIPNRFLWHVMYCLVQGLIGMAYPNVRNKVPYDEEIPLDEEGNPEPPCHFVHFDIDERNVFAALDPETDGIPIIKIADYGLVENFSPEFVEQQALVYDEYSFWHQRSMGKSTNFTPEQFTMEWDNLGIPTDEPMHKFLPNDKRKPAVAGNYGIHTNVFQIGILMHTIMTLRIWDRPYKKQLVESNGRKYDTFGYRLDAEDLPGQMERELRDLVMACMEYTPANRPTLLELQTQVRERIDKGFDMDDAALAKWCQKFFLTPHLPDWRDIIKGMPRPAPAPSTGKRTRPNTTNSVKESPSKKQRAADDTNANPRAGRNSQQTHSSTQVSSGLSRDSKERKLGNAQRSCHLKGQLLDQFNDLQQQQDELEREALDLENRQMQLHEMIEKNLPADKQAIEAEIQVQRDRIYDLDDELAKAEQKWAAEDQTRGPPTAATQEERQKYRKEMGRKRLEADLLRMTADGKMDKIDELINERWMEIEDQQLDARKKRAAALELKRKQMHLGESPQNPPAPPKKPLNGCVPPWYPGPPPAVPTRPLPPLPQQQQTLPSLPQQLQTLQQEEASLVRKGKMEERRVLQQGNRKASDLAKVHQHQLDQASKAPGLTDGVRHRNVQALQAQHMQEFSDLQRQMAQHNRVVQGTVNRDLAQVRGHMQQVRRMMQMIQQNPFPGQQQQHLFPGLPGQQQQQVFQGQSQQQMMQQPFQGQPQQHPFQGQPPQQPFQGQPPMWLPALPPPIPVWQPQSQQPFQGQPFQQQPFQGQPFQGQPFQQQPFQGQPQHPFQQQPFQQPAPQPALQPQQLPPQMMPALQPQQLAPQQPQQLPVKMDVDQAFQTGSGAQP